MWDTVIVLDGPLDGGTVDAVRTDVTSDPSDDTVDLDWWRRTVAWVVSDAGRGTIIDEDLGGVRIEVSSACHSVCLDPCSEECREE